MEIDWGYATIIGLFVTAAIGYMFHDSSDPWTSAMYISGMILIGKAWVWLFGA